VERGHDYDPRKFGWATGSAASINDSGQIVGVSALTSSGSVAHAALWSGNTITDLGTLGGNVSVAQNINAAGQIVGFAQTAAGVAHATLWSNDTITDLGTLGETTISVANAINNLGQIVGRSSTDISNTSSAILWKGG